MIDLLLFVVAVFTAIFSIAGVSVAYDDESTFKQLVKDMKYECTSRFTKGANFILFVLWSWVAFWIATSWIISRPFILAWVKYIPNSGRVVQLWNKLFIAPKNDGCD